MWVREVNLSAAQRFINTHNSAASGHRLNWPKTMRNRLTAYTSKMAQPTSRPRTLQLITFCDLLSDYGSEPLIGLRFTQYLEAYSSVCSS